MAKDLHWFKFVCSEWTDGDITMCSMSAQGLFANLMAFYWSRECEVTAAKARKKYQAYSAEYDELIEAEIIKIDGDFIRISFLDEQKEEVQKTGEKNSKNGKLGGRGNKANKAKLKPKESDPKATTNPKETQTKAIREDKIFSGQKRAEEVVSLSQPNGQTTTPALKAGSGLSLVSTSKNPKTVETRASFLEDILPYKFTQGEVWEMLEEFDGIPDDQVVAFYAQFRRSYKIGENEKRKPTPEEIINLLYTYTLIDNGEDEV